MVGEHALVLKTIRVSAQVIPTVFIDIYALLPY